MTPASRVTLDGHITNHPTLALYGAVGFGTGCAVIRGIRAVRGGGVCSAAVMLELQNVHPRTRKRTQIRQGVRIARHEPFERASAALVRSSAAVDTNKRQAARDGDENRDPSNRRLLRPDGPLRTLAQLPGDLDWLAGQYQPRGLEQDLVLRRADLGLDDLDRELLAA